ncbi:NAD(P)-dependent oxidoreductase [Demequina silvatica]|uniref:NAD(P)-dependent oxidoreductase n=1 Tax=Demequina silvatica TaxID=1638988 RepID=UPI000783D391|nr:NAD(P)H-binding protein [Demequina silvatica]
MTDPASPHVLIAGVGGLGAHMVDEALSRGARVSVLVRDEGRLLARIGTDTMARLESVIIGDATDPEALDLALRGVDVVLSGNGAHRTMARELAAACRRNGAKKLCWPAGGTNVMSEDGVTPAYVQFVSQWPAAEAVYRAHQACIDAIRDEGINYVIFCPGRMASIGHLSAEVRGAIRVNRPAGMFVSYEDAAWVMLEAALTDAYDRELISAATA